MSEDVKSPETEDDKPDEGKKKPEKKKKKKKKKFVDDGRTIYSMDGLTGRKKDEDSVGMSKKEKRAAIKAAFAHYLPIFLGVLGCFTAAILLIYLWLNH